MNKASTTRYPIHELLASRWSSRSFSSRPVESEKIGSLLEAARWAPSCYNDQPWTFMVAPKSDPRGFEQFTSCLLDGNSWAKAAPLMILTLARLRFDHNGVENRHATHDVGLATGNMVLQAEALGLATHQLGGFDAERARQVLEIPAEFEPVCMIAVGYRDEPELLSGVLLEKELATRARKELEAIAFGSEWSQPWDATKTES